MSLSFICASPLTVSQPYILLLTSPILPSLLSSSSSFYSFAVLNYCILPILPLSLYPSRDLSYPSVVTVLLFLLLFFCCPQLVYPSYPPHIPLSLALSLSLGLLLNYPILSFRLSLVLHHDLLFFCCPQLSSQFSLSAILITLSFYPSSFLPVQSFCLPILFLRFSLALLLLLALIPLPQLFSFLLLYFCSPQLSPFAHYSIHPSRSSHPAQIVAPNYELPDQIQ